MKFATELKRLSEAATAGKWKFSEHPFGVEGENGRGICEMWMRGDKQQERASAELIVYLRNHCDAIAKLVEAGDHIMRILDHPTDSVSIFDADKLRDALADLNKED